jgi:hypothetical protein
MLAASSHTCELLKPWMSDISAAHPIIVTRSSDLANGRAEPRGLASATSREPDIVLDREWLYADSMLDWKAYQIVERVPDRVSGAWVFEDTRVPVRALFENLEPAPPSRLPAVVPRRHA